MYIYIYIYTHTYICVYVCTYMYIYIYKQYITPERSDLIHIMSAVTKEKKPLIIKSSVTQGYEEKKEITPAAMIK